MNIQNGLKTFIKAGDINLDTSVNVANVIVSQQVLTGSSLSGTSSILGECNDDGLVGLDEVIYTLQDEAEVCTANLMEYCITEELCNKQSLFWYDGECHTIRFDV